MNGLMLTNALEVMKEFKQLSIKEMRKTTRTALRRAAFIIAKLTKKNLKLKLKAATKPNPKYSDTLMKGVVYGSNKKGTYAQVNVFGVNTPKSGTFRLRFFEKGTVVRKHKNGRLVGRIKALNFFSSAVMTTKGKVTTELETKIINTIRAINEKKLASESKI